MADPIAAAFVTVAADTKPFIAQIEALRLLAAKPIVVPVTALGGANGAAGMQTASASIQKSLGGVHASSVKAGQGMLSASSEANAARGALIGLARVTPVAVFGLGVIGTAAIGAGLAIKASVNAAAQLEQQLNIFGAVAGATAGEMAAVSAQAKALGSDLTLPATSANDAATAMTELAKAGLTVNDTLAASRGVMELAAAANITAGQAATITATQLNAFGLAGSNATKITDLLAGASIAAQGEITDFAAAFQQVSAVSHQVGLSVEDTTGLLTELAKAGLRGADGGTSLRTTLLRLVPTTKQAAEFVKALGININEQIPIGQQITSVIEQYRVALSKLNPIQQQEALTQIFGQDAIRAASIIFSQEPLALQKLVAQVSEAGSGARLAEARMKGFAGAVEGLKSSATTLGGTLGAVVLPSLTAIVKTLSSVTTAATEAAGALGKVGGVTVKPVANVLGGADTLAPLALVAGAGFGIQALLRRRAVAAAVARAEVVSAGVTARAWLGTEQQILVEALRVADAQILAAERVAAANVAAAGVSGRAWKLYGAVVATAAGTALKNVLAANKGLAAGAALSVAGGLVPGQAGSALSLIGTGAVIGSFFPGAGTAIGAGVGAGAAAISLLLNEKKKAAVARAKIKATWQGMSYEEQQQYLLDQFPDHADPKATDNLLKIILSGTTSKRVSFPGSTSRGGTSSRQVTTSAADFLKQQGGFAPLPALPGNIQELFRADLERNAVNKFAKALAAEPIVLPLPKFTEDKTGQATNKIALAQYEATMTGDTNKLSAVLQTQLSLMQAALAKARTRADASAPIKFFSQGAKGMAALKEWAKQHIKDVEDYTKLLQLINGKVVEANSVAIAELQTPSFTLQLGQLVAAGTTGSGDDVAEARKRVAEEEAIIAGFTSKTTKAVREAAALELQTRKNNVVAAQGQLAAEQKQAQAEHDQAKKAAEQKKADALALLVANAKASIDLQNARLQNRLALAEGTPGKTDDKKVMQQMISFNVAQIKALRGEEDGLAKTSLKYKEKELAVQGLVNANIRLRQSIKGLNDTSSGFSISDLFKEALNQFQEFGSNVSTNPLAPGGVRGAFAGNLITAITGSKESRKELGLDRVATSTSSMDLTLKNIERLLRGEPAPKGSTVGDKHVGRLTSKQAAGLASRRFGGA